VTRLAVLGPSGIGKTPLSKLFKLEHWQPFRVRTPRNAEDATSCKTPEEYAKIEAEHAGETPLYEGSDQLRVYRDVSLFEVRGTKQCLDHTTSAKDATTPLLVEVYAPVFVQLLRNAGRLRDAFAMDPDSFAVLLLNPLWTTYSDMDSAPAEMPLAVHTGILERSRLLGAGIDLADIIRRAGSVHEELPAWREVFDLVPHGVIECRGWAHFEYRYMSRELGRPASELLRARETVLSAVREQAPHLLTDVHAVVRSPEAIVGLSDIV